MADKSTLRVLEAIGDGAEGTVYRIDGVYVGGSRMAFKEVGGAYPLTDAQRQKILRNMRQAVAVRDGLPQGERDKLDAYTAWPTEMVRDGHEEVGCLMPLLEDDFFFTNTQGKRKVTELSWLPASDSTAKKQGFDRSSFSDLLIRQAIVLQLAYIIAFLHRHGIVYGDLSLKNVAFAANPPRIRLMDCDATSLLSDPKRGGQGHSPFFTPPEIKAQAQHLQDHQTDVYKLGLCITRGLALGDYASQLTTPKDLAVDSKLKALLFRALSTNRADRPTAEELYDQCVQAVLRQASPPVINHASVSQTRVLRGNDIAIVWDIVGAKTIDIWLPGGSVKRVQGSNLTTRIDSSGPLTITAENRHGAVQVDLGYIDVYELPAFNLSTSWLPRPTVPALAPVLLPEALSALSPIPRVSERKHPAPVLVEADTSWVAEHVREVSHALADLTGSYGAAISRSSTEAVRITRGLVPGAPGTLAAEDDYRRVRRFLKDETESFMKTLRELIVEELRKGWPPCP